jgi:hypothetical protein
MDEQTKEPQFDGSNDYLKRISELLRMATNCKLNGDHKGCLSILTELEGELIPRITDQEIKKSEQLKDVATSLVMSHHQRGVFVSIENVENSLQEWKNFLNLAAHKNGLVMKDREKPEYRRFEDK